MCYEMIRMPQGKEQGYLTQLKKKTDKKSEIFKTWRGFLILRIGKDFLAFSVENFLSVFFFFN